MITWKKFAPIFSYLAVYAAIVCFVYFISPKEYKLENVMGALFFLSLALASRIWILLEDGASRNSEFTPSDRDEKLARACRFLGIGFVIIGLGCLIIFGFIFNQYMDEWWIPDIFVGAVLLGGFLVICGRAIQRYLPKK